MSFNRATIGRQSYIDVPDPDYPLRVARSRSIDATTAIEAAFEANDPDTRRALLTDALDALAAATDFGARALRALPRVHPVARLHPGGDATT